MVKPLRVLTWNAGHLGQQQWAELRTWLRTASDQYDVIALQETHWQESTEFDVEGWHCISSASKGKAKAPKAKSKPTPDHNSSEQPGTQPQDQRVHDDKRADGVMILTAPHIPKATIRWSEHHKERVLEVVFQWKGARVHIVSVYQHVWTTSKTAQQNREDRSKCLASLSKAVRGVPQRDTLVVLGDFNSTLNTSVGVVGTCTPGSPQHRSAEDAHFQRLVQGHGLVALNTWSSGSGLTFHTATSESQIDYILVPKSLARGESKQSKPLTDFPLGRWKKGGHSPVEATKRMWARLTALDEDLANSTLSSADHETLARDLSMTMLKQCFNGMTDCNLRSVPQFAYQPQRGLSDALSRLSKHTREDLMDTLHEAGAPSDIQGLVASLHSNSRYTESYSENSQRS
ncbi:unnamed protein product [Symbiodinium natans]|uniref:Endonuclease/exonuclease/phosphatase domain-containing protein n=1 Tax=Symbiodinium natans TaxID=878477 RepID=A0A812K2G1_9DINO|nr:unnamed protein product [Symbiodinium natans]